MNRSLAALDISRRHLLMLWLRLIALQLLLVSKKIMNRINFE